MIIQNILQSNQWIQHLWFRRNVFLLRIIFLLILHLFCFVIHFFLHFISFHLFYSLSIKYIKMHLDEIYISPPPPPSGPHPLSPSLSTSIPLLHLLRYSSLSLLLLKFLLFFEAAHHNEYKKKKKKKEERYKPRCCATSSQLSVATEFDLFQQKEINQCYFSALDLAHVCFLH